MRCSLVCLPVAAVWPASGTDVLQVRQVLRERLADFGDIMGKGQCSSDGAIEGGADALVQAVPEDGTIP